MREALQAAGLVDRPRVTWRHGRYIGYLEGHIEQGGTLESENLKIGIVIAIVSMRWYRIIFVGQQNHAGTTRMEHRRDAGVALAKFQVAMEHRFSEACGPWTVWTTDHIKPEPGAAAIIPGRAEMMLNVRDKNPDVLARLEEVIRRMVDEFNANGPCRVTLEHIRTAPPIIMDANIQQAIEDASVDFAAGEYLRMPSGAGHDAQSLSAVMPVGMLFVPSIGGISHHWTENTSDTDIVRGAQVFVDAARRLLTQ